MTTPAFCHRWLKPLSTTFQFYRKNLLYLSTRGKTKTCRKSLTNYINVCLSHKDVSNTHRHDNYHHHHDSPLIFLYWLVGWFMVFNANFNNISVLLWQSVLLVEETEVSGENHRPATSHLPTLSHNVVSSTLRHE